MEGVFEKGKNGKYIGYKLVGNRKCETQYKCRFDLNVKTYGVSCNRDKIWFCSSEEEAKKWEKHLEYIYMIKVEVDDYIYDTKSTKELPSYYTTSGVTRISEPEIILADNVSLYLYEDIINRSSDISDEDRVSILNFILDTGKDKYLFYLTEHRIRQNIIYEYEVKKKLPVPDLFYGILYGNEFKNEYDTFEKSVKESICKILNIKHKRDECGVYKDQLIVLYAYENYDKIGEKGINLISKYFNIVNQETIKDFFYSEKKFHLCKFISDKFHVFLENSEFTFLVTSIWRSMICNKNYPCIEEYLDTLKYLLTKDKEEREKIKKNLYLTLSGNDYYKRVLDNYRDIIYSFLESI